MSENLWYDSEFLYRFNQVLELGYDYQNYQNSDFVPKSCFFKLALRFLPTPIDHKIVVNFTHQLKSNVGDYYWNYIFNAEYVIPHRIKQYSFDENSKNLISLIKNDIIPHMQ